MRINSWLRVAGVFALSAMISGGCVVTVDDGDDNGGNGGGNDPPAQLTVRIINASNVTLDPEIFIASEGVSADELFDPSRKFTAFGVGTLGLIADSDATEFTIDCAQARVIGTSGGRFGNDLNNPDGTGRRIVLTQDLNVFCEGAVTFTYSGAGSGFSTTFDVEP